MTCTISLGPDNTLALRTPSGRELLVPVSPHATGMLWQILWNSSQERRAVAGRSYAGEFPAQSVIDAWAKDIMPERRAEEAAEAAAARQEKLEAKLGVRLASLDFNL